ncbi:MAG: hypothetical protein MUP90_00505 [Gammaproteobacteria bacterium]|nr:hypothetical protein [Gammaproteobacteria bacterium]
MNNFRGFIFLTIAFVASCVLQANVSHAEGTLFKKDEVLRNGAKVSVLVSVSEYVADGLMYSAPLWWGAELSPPRTFIKQLTVRFGENESLVRFSAYSDLVNINSVDLTVVNKGFNIAIDGGENATHYKAVIYFDNEGFLLRRKVYSPSFPDEVWEETKYSFIRRQDM